jgi:hypothetical protein
MARKPKLWVCDIAHKCGFAYKCKHAKPHKKIKSCSTPCKRRTATYKCKRAITCPHCDGDGYTLMGRKKK